GWTASLCSILSIHRGIGPVLPMSPAAKGPHPEQRESFSSCWSLSPQELRMRPVHALDQSKVFSARFHRRRVGSHSSLGQWPQHLCRRKSLRESVPTQRLL